jgi:aspartyl-tRNA(Asn)/glutamyl-tRNA(Gln) amidotransferase subunit C
MPISRKEVEKVSLLGRLLLSQQELDTMTSQLGEILGYMEMLNELDTAAVAPMAHPLDISDVMREDRIEASLDREEALRNAPKRDQECYLVPAVFEI